MSLDKYLNEIDLERQQNHRYNADQLHFWLESLNKSIQEVYQDSLQVKKYLERLREDSNEAI
jgi:hypothetical protein